MPPRGSGRRAPAPARLRRRARPLSGGLPDLRHAQCRQVQRRPDLPCADPRPVRGRAASGDRQGRLVGEPGRAGQGARSGALLHHLRQCAGRLHGHDRPARLRSGDRPAVEPALSGGDHRRHGARPGGPARSSRHPRPVLRDRRLDGRHAGAGMGGELSRARLLRRADRLCGPPFGAEHRLPRGRPPGDHGRSRMEGRRLPPAPDRAGARPGGRAHDRAHHLSFGAGAAAQVRPRPAGPQCAGLRLRRRLPGRELPAPPGLDLRRPLRRQQLPLHHAGDGLFRPRRRAMAACWPTPSAARRRASA